MIKYVILLATLFFAFLATSQENQKLYALETDLSNKLAELRSVKVDSSINKLNAEFKELLGNALEEDKAFDYPFSSLKTVGKIYSQDKLVRIFSWNVQYEDQSNNYYSFIMKKDERRDRVHVVELKRQKQPLQALIRETIDHENWYGALYYEIVDVEKGNRTYYTLLGYDANNRRSTIKFLDILYFTGKYPKFGYPLFETENGYVNRVIFEYSAKATISLKYDPERQKIIFDHLSPETPNLKEFKEYYVPDMSYDAYVFEKNKWRLQEDIIAVNSEQSDQVDLKAYDSDADTVVTIQTKGKWINPDDKNAPLDGGGHRAVTPEDLEAEKNGKSPKNKKNKVKRPKKEGFGGVSYSNLPEKKNKKRKKRD
jgi:hypothetical protein